MSHIALTYHLIFSTYRRQGVIDQDHERELYKYIHDYSAAKDVHVRRIGGMPDHVHILCDIPPKLPVASFVQTLKTESSKFMRVNGHFPSWSGWSEGYGAFSINVSMREPVRRYIMNQKEHHGNKSFMDEYRAFLTEAGFPDDEKILGDE